MSVIEEAIQGVERELLRLLSEQERPRILVDAMRWAVEGGGKRVLRLPAARDDHEAACALVKPSYCTEGMALPLS